MRLSETESLFVDAAKREFRFLALEHGFLEEPVEWNGQGISVDHVSQTLEVSNYLESEDAYSTFVFPLRAGVRLPTFDDDMDEPFSYFLAEDLLAGPPPSGVAAGTFPAREDLLNAVSARAAVLRENIGPLIRDPEAMIAQVRDRRREKLLRQLVPQWVQFVERVRGGYTGSGSGYVAGINNRGAIRTLVGWPGSIPPEVEHELREADMRFDAATEPIALEPGEVRVLPHPRATRWFRRPKGGGSLVER